MISTIVFDYGGVIEIKDRDLIQDIAEYLNITKEKWNEVYYTLNHLCNTGEKSGNEVLCMTADKIGVSSEQLSHIKNIIAESKNNRRINTELIEIIKELKKRDYKIGLLSNNSIKLRQKLVDQDIMHLFDEVIMSSEVGYQKPQPEIFELVLNRFGIQADELIFVDDTEKSLEGAEKIGYTPILYTDNDKLKTDISLICKIVI